MRARSDDYTHEKENYQLYTSHVSRVTYHCGNSSKWLSRHHAESYRYMFGVYRNWLNVELFNLHLHFYIISILLDLRGVQYIQVAQKVYVYPDLTAIPVREPLPLVL